ncbi:uncharacterized protein LOC125207740 isoform X2 [Salvia hispanica]|uniref:uncharacterized protein LOC125207740 isoform X2 n=1 Tax=Salvia hispanica TaxID=49212 RepID=UPI0020098DDF|nr:uncharacterized protein LOC125207740 isoform X2 [Salvia hispanica]
MIWDMMRRAFGVADTTIEQDTNPVGTLTQSMSQEECRGSQWSETLDALLKGAEELLHKRHEFPSFSLGMGFTQDLYAEADIGGGSGGLGSVNEVLIHEKHTTDDDLLIEATVGNFQYQGSISTRSMQLVRIKNYKVELMLKPFHIFKGGWSDNDIEEHHLLVASLTEYDESLCHEKGTNAEIANAIKLTNSIVQDIAREALGVEKGKQKAHGPTLEVSEYQDRRQTTHKIAMEVPPISVELVRGVRMRATKRKSPALCSPYNERAVPIMIKQSAEERDMYYWLVWTQGENDNMEVYFDDTVLLTKIQMISMKPHSHVFEKVVDAWASYLNHMELYRAPSSPSRVFMTTFPCFPRSYSRLGSCYWVSSFLSEC